MEEERLYINVDSPMSGEDISERQAEEIAEELDGQSGGAGEEQEPRDTEDAERAVKAERPCGREKSKTERTAKFKDSASDKRDIGKPSKRRKGEPELDTDRDRLICAIASFVALASAIAFALLLGSSVGNMADMLKGLEAAERVMAAIANLMLTFGLGIGALVLSAIAFTFAKRAHSGASGRWKNPTLALMLLPCVVAFAVLIMLAVSVVLVL